MKVDFEEYDEAKEKAGAETTVERSKLLGYGDLIQGEILTECERVSRGIYCGNAEYYKNATPAEKAEINKAATDWILLFQFASVWRDDFELMWGDCGNLYFYIKKQDLAERNFDNIWLVLQC